MTETKPQGGNNSDDQGNENVTEAAEVLHGEQAREEQYPQPTEGDVVTLDGDTRVAKASADADE